MAIFSWVLVFHSRGIEILARKRTEEKQTNYLGRLIEMAFYDWNHNGKKDWQDNFIEYNIYKKRMENINKDGGGSGSGSGNGISTFATVIIILGILFFVGYIMQACEP